MSLEVNIGKRGNILEVGPENASQVNLSSPVLNEGELESLLKDPHLKPRVLPTFFDIRKGVEGSLQKRLNKLCEAADEAVRNGSQLLVLSDRSDELEPTRPGIPILLAVGAVHQHLIQNGLRMSASIVADTAQCFSTHHFACLIGYGARRMLLGLDAQRAAQGPQVAPCTCTHGLKHGHVKDKSKWLSGWVMDAWAEVCNMGSTRHMTQHVDTCIRPWVCSNGASCQQCGSAIRPQVCSNMASHLNMSSNMVDSIWSDKPRVTLIVLHQSVSLAQGYNALYNGNEGHGCNAWHQPDFIFGSGAKATQSGLPRIRTCVAMLLPQCVALLLGGYGSYITIPTSSNGMFEFKWTDACGKAVVYISPLAVCPYLALETCRQWRLSNKTVNLMRNGKMPTVTIEQAQKNFCKDKFYALQGIKLLHYPKVEKYFPENLSSLYNFHGFFLIWLGMQHGLLGWVGNQPNSNPTFKRFCLKPTELNLQPEVVNLNPT
ncbi:Ferredoxin-dependent glutamate synthase, chloroplastic [Vitis vinifera]|uniref:Ferredoxin-dependent glutamate synthase, chloroplastic n=1 Tax=Vitis vinifera TaxID=29760 RepID=A0A438DKF8_VITVI|nr:Ferredoxin-dependent glutamate synthase, chloroplastic [Vitis vinifera]